jgi:DNA transformation protein
MSDFVEFLEEVFAEFGPITTRHMFGAHGIYQDGLMFGLLAQGRLYLKTDAVNLPEFEVVHSEPFTFEQRGKPVKLSYWHAPDFILDDREQAAAWAHSAFAAAMRAQEAKERHAAPPWRRK